MLRPVKKQSSHSKEPHPSAGDRLVTRTFTWGRRSRAFRTLCLLHLAILTGCTLTDTRRRDWSDYSGPGAEYFRRAEVFEVEELEDPAEPLNRGLAVFNHGLMLGFYDPLSRVYRWILPGPARAALGRLAQNLAFPKRLVNNLFQGKLAGAGRETVRFLLNTTIGIAGLFDPASRAGIEPSDLGFSETFAFYGWDGNAYFMAPFLGPGSDRDTPADILDLVFNPAAYIPGAVTLFRLNRETDGMAEYKRFVRSNYDPYTFTRYLFDVAQRHRHIDLEFGERESTFAQTLRAMFLTFQDEDFPGELDDDEVLIPATGEELPFTYIMQDDPAPLLFVLPGLGGHRDSDSSLAFMELAHRHGFSAVAISNSMNFEFMEAASSAAVPGFGPVDAHDTHVALDLIHRWLQEEYPERITATALLGLSLGGYHALQIAAAADDPESALIRFDRYVPINPPVSLMNGMQQLDRCFNAPMEWPEQDRRELMSDAIVKTLKLGNGQLDSTEPLPLSESEARFLIGLGFRLNLMFAIHSSQSRENLGVLLTDLSGPARKPAYEEIFDYSYLEYFYAFVVPYFSRHRDDFRSAEDMVRLSDLRHLEDRLRELHSVRLFSTDNDFLLSAEDAAWIQDVFGEQHTNSFETGGHLGNLDRPEIQDAIIASLSDLLPAG